MKFYLFIIFCAFSLSNALGQIKNYQIKNDSVFSYYRDENQQSVTLKGKIDNGAYRLFIDTILFAYVEIKNNQFNGAMIYFNSIDKSINKLGLVKNNKYYGTWIYCLNGKIFYIENITNEVKKIRWGNGIEFLGKRWDVIKKIDFEDIIEK